MRLFFTVLTLLFSQLLFGQDSLGTQLPEISVSQTRLDIPFQETSHAISIVTKEQIQALPAQSVVELIQHFAAVDIRQRGIHGIQADISLRGSGIDQVLVLLDGIPMIDPQTGHHSLNLPINKEAIQQIEIIKGPAARIYGPNAFAGAINIVTKQSSKQSLSAQATGGSYGLWSVQMNADVPKYGTRFSFKTQSSDGYKYNTDYRMTNAFWQQRLKTGSIQWKLVSGLTSRQFGANGFYASPKFKDQYEEIQTSFITLQSSFQLDTWRLTPKIYWRRNQDLYVFIRDKPEVYRNLHISQNLGGELHARHKIGHYTTGLGLTANQFLLESNNLGSHQRTSIGFFAEERIQLFDNQLDIIPGFNLHYYSDFGTKFFPGLDIGWKANRHWRLYANAGYTWRVPTYTDLFYESKANLGNPNLEPESAFTTEIGVKYHRQDWSISTALFRRDGQDIIDWTKAIDTVKWQPNNFSQIIVNGLEATIHWQPSHFPIRVSTNYTYLQSTFDKPEAIISKYALSNLRHQWNTSIQLRIYKKGNVNLSYRWLDRVNLPNYGIVDAKLSWPIKRIKFFAQANNLLNEKYTETNLVEMPGTWLVGGMRVRW